MRKLFDEIPRLESANLILDGVRDEDEYALQELVGNDSVYRHLPTYLFERQYSDPQEIIRGFYGDLFQSQSSLIVAVRLKESDSFCGLAEFYGLRDDVHKISIGYRLLERCWGNGIATETVRMMVSYLYSQTDIQIITASTMIENYASARVLEKNDFICTAHSVEEDWGYPTPTIADKWFC